MGLGIATALWFVSGWLFDVNGSWAGLLGIGALFMSLSAALATIYGVVMWIALGLRMLRGHRSLPRA